MPPTMQIETALSSATPTPTSSKAEPRRNERSKRYEAAIEASRRVRWDIDADVIRGRQFELSTSFLPAGLTLVDELPFLSAADRRLWSQVQGRTYANIFGLVERYINAKMLDLARDHWSGDQTALEALVRFSDEELKHQELFRRIEAQLSRIMPAGYRFLAEPNAVAGAVLSKSTWAVLALTCHIELFTQTHYRESIDPDPELSPLYKDVFLFHWKEESQHAILDELEWLRADEALSPLGRDAAVDDFIALVGAVDGILQAQAEADAGYFFANASGRSGPAEAPRIRAGMLRAYRWQFILSGAQHPRFGALLGRLITPEQGARIGRALTPLMS